MLRVVDNLLLDHVRLPQVVVVAVHLVILFAGLPFPSPSPSSLTIVSLLNLFNLAERLENFFWQSVQKIKETRKR